MSRPNTLSTRIEEKLAVLTQIAKERCMCKVHDDLRDVNEKAYKPVLLAIGPYNDQGNVGHGFMEEHKLRYLQQMLKRTNISVEKYINALRNLEKRAREYYAECISQTQSCLGQNDAFVEMMLLDGCFIIELFHRYENRGVSKDDPIFQKEWVLPRIARDLLLFENQLPLFVLAILFCMSESTESRNSEEYIVDFEVNSMMLKHALRFFSRFSPFKWKDVNNSTERITDLLDLTLAAPNPSLPVMICERLELGFRFKNAEFEHLLGLIHATICISILDTEIDNAKERQEVGVKCKMAKIFKHPFGPIGKAVTSLRAKMKPLVGASLTTEPLLADASLSEEPSAFAVTVSGASLSEEPLVGASLIEPLSVAVTPRGASLSIQPLDEEPLLGASLPMDGASSSQVSRFPVDIVEKWKHLINFLELEETGVETKACQFVFKLNEICRWRKIPYAIQLQEAEIEFKKLPEIFYETGTLMPGVESKNAEELESLLRDAGVDNNKVKKFMRLREIEHRNIHGATELEEAGIKIKKEEGNAFSIKYNNGLMNGQLKLSPLNIVDETETYLRNLIAYEQYYDRKNGFNYVTNFVFFMDDLINSPKDVELLRRSGIIRNYLGDDEVVSTMVNKLCHNITISPQRSIYARTSVDLNMHCSKPWNLRMAKLRHDYFNSPWALVSFLAALLLLALTITQTIFSIIP